MPLNLSSFISIKVYNTINIPQSVLTFNTFATEADISGLKQEIRAMKKDTLGTCQRPLVHGVVRLYIKIKPNLF
jgi:hypothetical protein